MKQSPFEHLPRRSLFAVNTNPARVNTNPEPVVDQPEPVAEPVVEPPPLMDTTQRGRGRPTMHVDRAAYRREWMARKRAEKRHNSRLSYPQAAADDAAALAEAGQAPATR
jgi:hypothetical protein